MAHLSVIERPSEVLESGDGKGEAEVELVDLVASQGESPSPPEDSEQELLTETENSNKDTSPGTEVTLRKELSLISGIAYIVGSIIGSGIFITPRGILENTGSFGLSLVMWVIGGLTAVAGALCYIELGTFIKKSGGDYTYILEAYSFKKRKPWLEFTGSLLAFLFTWTSVLVVRTTSLAIITMAFGRYLSRPFFIVGGCDVPIWIVRLLALFAITLLAMINCYSIKLSAKMMTVLTFLKLVACGFVIALGVYHLIRTGCLPEDSRHPFQGSTTNPVNWALALYGVMWACDAWNQLNYGVEEFRNVEKTLPRAVLIGVAIVITTYLLINFSFFSVLSYDQILHNEAVALPLGQVVLGKAGLVIVPLLVALTTFGAAHGSLFAGSRIFFVAARDGLLPDMFSGVHRTFKTPMPATLLQALLASVWVLIGNIDSLINSFNAAIWVFYGLVFVGFLIMRVTHRDQPRPYKVWLIFPVFMVVIAFLLVVLPVVQEPLPSLLAFGAILLGVPVYIFLVMETPRKLRPRVLDRISGMHITLEYALTIAIGSSLKYVLANEETFSSEESEPSARLISADKHQSTL